MDHVNGHRAAEPLPFDDSRAASELSLVEIAEQLEKVTGWIEAQRVREREARAVYTAVQQQTEDAISRIRTYAQELVKHHQRKMTSFDGLLGSKQEVKPMPQGRGHSRPNRPAPRNIAQAIVELWMPGRPGEALTTEEIAASLPEVGYSTEAAPNSLKSSVNQALAKLCKIGTIVRLRADGSPIPPKDKTSRARKYLAAARLPEGLVVG
jgi:hypothetical protein